MSADLVLSKHILTCQVFIIKMENTERDFFSRRKATIFPRRKSPKAFQKCTQTRTKTSIDFHELKKVFKFVIYEMYPSNTP